MIFVNDKQVSLSNFPDNTLMIKELNKHFIYGGSVYIKWNYENDAELFALACIRKYADQFYPNYIELDMPYCPHARMDRVKNSGDLFTLKYFAEIINSLNFSRVRILDAHSNVAPALIDRVRNCSPAPFIEKAISNIKNEANLIAFYPDEGAMKRYSDIANMPYAFGIKKRDWNTGKIEGLNIQNQELVKDKDVLIIDDICSRGGTFLHSAFALKAAGAKRIFLYVTHLEETVRQGELWTEMIQNKLIEKIYTADPLFNIDEQINKYVYHLEIDD